MFGDATGYNVENVNALRDVINNTAQKAGEGIVDRLHSEIIVPMSTAWYAPEAQIFFQGFKATVATSGESIREAFDTFRAAIQRAGENWAENTKGAQPHLSTIDAVILALSVDDIQGVDEQGNVIIYKSSAETVANNLDQVEQNIKADLSQLASQLDAATAFIGGNQASAIQDCFIKVGEAIHKIFKYLTEGEENLQNQITKAVAKYGDVAQNISTAFTSVNINNQL